VTLFTFAAECRAVNSAAAMLVVYTLHSASNPPHVGRMMGQTDGQAQDHVIGSAPYTMRAVSII